MGARTGGVREGASGEAHMRCARELDAGNCGAICPMQRERLGSDRASNLDFVLHTNSVRRERHNKRNGDAPNADFHAELTEETSPSRRNVMSRSLDLFAGRLLSV